MDPKLNEEFIENVAHFLCYQFVPKPRKIIDDVPNQIEPNFDFLDILDGNLISYDEEKICKDTRDILTQVVSSRIKRTGGRAALLLSGGMDSAILLHILSQQEIPITTITFSYEKKSENLKIARNLSEKYGTDHIEMIVSGLDLDHLDSLYENSIKPIGDNGFLAMSKMLEKLPEDTSLVVSGDGADCLFGGLPSHYLDHIDRKYLEDLNLENIGPRARNYQMQKRTYKGFHHYKFGEVFLTNEETSNIFGKSIDVNRTLDEIYKTTSIKDMFKKNIFIDLKFYVPNRVDYILNAGKITRKNIFLPFLDKKFVKYCSKIPGELLIKNLQQKYILKKAFRGIVEDSILNKLKEGSSPPFARWYSLDKGNVIKRIRECEKLGIGSSYIESLINTIGRNNYDSSMRIWLLLNLGAWYKSFR